jgi:hypothetical protein
VEEIVTKQLIAQMVEATEKSVADLVEKASNQAIAKKLGQLGGVCKTIVMETKKVFSVAEVARQYNDRYPKLPLSEQTIRNKRSNGNPYMAVYREWEKVAHAVATAARTGQRRDGTILRESDLHTIKDPTLRHQVTMVFAQNRSLHNSVNMLKKLQGQGQIRVSLDGLGQPTLPQGGESLVLTSAELEAIRDFIDRRKLKAKHLKPTKDDGVSTIEGQSVADPGFLTALQKISKSYERPE